MEDYKKFTTKSFIFCLIVCLCIFFVNDYFFKRVITKTITYRQFESLNQYLSTSNNTIQIAFMGNSHTMYAINPQFIANAFNLGGSAEVMSEIYYKLRFLVEENEVDIQNIVLQIDLNSLGGRRSRRAGELWYYADIMPLAELAKLEKKGLIKVWLKAQYPFIGNGRDFFEIAQKDEFRIIYKGWTEYTENFALSNKSIEENLFQRREQLEEFCLIKIENLEYFQKIIEFAQKNKINLVFIKYPMTLYEDKIYKALNIDRDNFYAEIETYIPEESLVLDYYDIFFNYPEYFQNENHLNSTGASILSQKVNQDLSLLSK